MASNLQAAAATPLQISFPLPNTPNTKVHLSLSRLSHAILLFLTTSSSSSAGTTPLGSFVYAIPNVRLPLLSPLFHAYTTNANNSHQLRNPTSIPSSTPLYSDLNTVDFATRLATIIAKRTGSPTYVGSSISIASAGRGGDVNEEMDSFRKILEVSLAVIERETRRVEG